MNGNFWGLARGFLTEPSPVLVYAFSGEKAYAYFLITSSATCCGTGS